MEKDNKKTWLIVAVLAILAVVIVIAMMNFNKPTATDQTIDETLSGYTGEFTMDDRVVFESYLMSNISTLSPQKEVLGGKFYVTTIDWLDDRSGAVSYEDGHIALRADFKFTYADAAGTVPKIEYFNIHSAPVETGEPVLELGTEVIVEPVVE